MKYDVIVIGAGPAGMTATRDLRDRGKSVLLLEARDRIGGRTHTRPLEGYPDVMVELGGTYIHSAVQHNLRREIQRYDTPTVSGSAPELGPVLFMNDGRVTTGMPVPPEELYALEQAIVLMTNASRRIDTNAPLELQPLADIDVSPDEFFASLELPAQTRAFIFGVIAGVLQSDVEEVSMLQYLIVQAACQFSPLVTYFGMTDEKLRDGTIALWTAMYEEAAPDTQFETDVSAVVQDADGVRVETLGGDVFTAEVCVVAVPTQVLDRIEFSPALPEERVDALADPYVQQGYKNLLIVENSPPGVLAYGDYGTPNEPEIGWLNEDAVLPDGRRLLVAWGRGERVNATVEEADAALKKWLPEAKVVAVDGHDWKRDTWARGIVKFYRPGRTLKFSATVGAPLDRVLFSGSDLARGIWSGWIEGGVESGHDAAGDALVRLRAAQGE